MKGGIFGVMIASLAVLSWQGAELEGCTRVLYVGEGEEVLTGRSMDWVEDMRSNLWIYPRGVERDGAVDAASPRWKSKYGSVTVSGYDVGTADGLNEKGLVANVLYLAESDYGKPTAKKPLLSISLWGQYALDNFATVAEAVQALKEEPFGIVAPLLPNGEPAQLHLSLSDRSGDSAIFEYVDGKLVIHHGKEFTVMTNSPIFSKQLALNEYWEEIGGATFLPGTSRAADRFVRASYYIKAIPKKVDSHFISAVPDKSFALQAAASVASVMRSVSVPLGLTTHEPNIASTLWRTIADQKNLIYYFDSATSPNVFWVELADLNFKEGAPILKLQVANGQVYSGNASHKAVEAQPYRFLPASAS